MTRRMLRSIVVAGDGIGGLSAAAAFARALPHLAVTVVAAGQDPAALIDRLPGAQPSIARFHRLIGLDEAEVIASGAATWRIATRFRSWSASGEDWYHVTGECGPRAGTVAFHHLWARALRAGEALPHHAYAAAGALATAGKFALPVDDPASPFSRYDYGLRIAPDRYRELLERQCDRLSVDRPSGRMVATDIDEAGTVTALRLDDGRRIEGDLFIDCSGAAASPLSYHGEKIEDWSDLLPACRIAIEGDGDEPAAVDDIMRTAGGWQWHAPGAGRGRVSDIDTRLADSVVITPGRLAAPWRHNVLAIGDAAVRLDPLGWFGLHLAHQAIERALSLLPDRDFAPIELAEYNRRAAQDARAVRDLAACFYHCPGAPDATFWRRANQLRVPKLFEHAVEIFRRRGYLPWIEEDTMGRDSRIAMLIGLGIIPDQTDPVAAAIDPGAMTAAMTRWAEGLAEAPSHLPAYGHYLDNTLRHLRGR